MCYAVKAAPCSWDGLSSHWVEQCHREFSSGVTSLATGNGRAITPEATGLSFCSPPHAGRDDCFFGQEPDEVFGLCLGVAIYENDIC